MKKSVGADMCVNQKCPTRYRYDGGGGVGREQRGRTRFYLQFSGISFNFLPLYFHIKPESCTISILAI